MREEVRIVSLLPSATEMVAALGVADRIVGRSHECDFPASISDAQPCTSSKVSKQISSEAIQWEIQQLLQQGLSVYDVDAKLLRALRPHVILTQSQCAVCAVTPADLEQALADWVAPDQPLLVSLAPESLGDVWDDLRRVGEAVGRSLQSEAVVNDLKARLDNIRAATARLETRPKVVAIEWMEPLMAAGNWVPELIEIAGGTNLLTRAGQHSPWISWNDLVAADPDVIVIMPCGFGAKRSLLDLPLLEKNPLWQQLRAVREQRVFIADGRQFFSRPGPRLVESAEILAEILHENRFDFGHRGLNWSSVDSGSSATIHGPAK